MRRTVVSVGEVLVDLVAPDAPDLETADRFLRTAGGAPANVAVAVARLGGTSALAGAVGPDAFGTYLRRTLEMEGVNTSALIDVESPTTLALVARNAGGIPDFVFYRGADAVFSADDLPGDLIESAAFVHLSSMALLSEPSRSATLRAAALTHEVGVLVSVDPNLRPKSWQSLETAREAVAPLLAAADVLKVNDEEARLLTNTGSIDDAATRLAVPGRLLVVTRGPHGCDWYFRTRSGRVPAPSVQVVDTTGAGDAFAGALLAELSRLGYSGDSLRTIQDEDLAGVLRFACAAGALACRQPGAMTSLPTRVEVEQLLRR